MAEFKETGVSDQDGTSIKKNPDTVDTISQSNNELIPAEGTFKNGVGPGYKVFQILEEILADKTLLGLPEKWIKYYELRKNKHWRKKAKNLSLVSANLVFTHIQRTTNLLTDNNPTFNVTRASNQEVDDEVYDKTNKMTDHWWREQEQQDVLETSVITGETCGCAIEHPHFDVNEGPDGEVVVDSIDPFNFGVYPVKTINSQKAMANLHYETMSVMEAKKAWPDFAEKIVADSDYIQELGSERRELSGTSAPGEPTNYLSTFSSVVSKMISSGADTKGGKSEDSAELVVVYCWVKDDTMEVKDVPVEILDEQGRSAGGASSQKQLVRKYPDRIRRIITCNGGRVVMSDGPNPNINYKDLTPEEQRSTYLWGRFPFTRVASIKDTVNGYGMTDLEQVEGIQREIDKSVSQFTTFKDKVVRLKFKVPKDSGIKDKEINNANGILRPTTGQSALGIGYVDPPSFPSDLIKSIEIYKDLFFLIAGTFDLDAAKSGGRDVIAYKAIAALIERASTMAKGKIRSYGKLIRERGRMYLSLAQNFYTDERWVSYEEEGREKGYSITGKELRIPMRMNVVTGSTLPVSHVQKREEALALFAKGAIDQIELLKTLNWDNYKDVVKRMEAGPIGMFINMLAEWGIPDQFLQMFQMIAQLEDDKELKKLIESGEIPSFQQMMQQMLAEMQGQQGQQQPSIEDQKGAKDIEETDAKIVKVKAETSLVSEKIKTEMKEQERLDVGIKLDKAMTVNKITSAAKPAGGAGSGNAYKETGVEANNAK